MGSGALSTRANLAVMTAAWWNVFQSALAGDIVPRDGTATAADLAGSLGSATYPWQRMQIKSGHFRLGDVKFRHSFNGLLTVGEGWMLCDGRQITQANYDAEHGAGAWAAHVVSSPLLNKYLPNLIGRYAVGKAATSQDGSAAITNVGNPSSIVSLQHSHRWYQNNGAGASDQTFDSSGNARSVARGTAKNANVGGVLAYSQTGTASFPTAYTDMRLGSSVSIQPESIEVQPYMRII
jgi:hypothetical protein